MTSLSRDLKAFNKNFDSLTFNIDLSREDIFERCKINSSSNISSLSFVDAQKILTFLNIDIRELIEGNVCAETVNAQLNGNPFAIRQKWIGNEGTRLQTIESSLSLIEVNKRRQILRKYQLKQDVFSDGARLVSAELLASIFKDTSAYAFTNSLELVGKVNCNYFLESVLKDELTDIKSPAGAYTHFIEHCTSIVEKNMDYKVVKAQSNRILLEYESKESLKDYFSVGHFGNIGFCQNIQGFFEELLKYRYEYPATVRKLSCAHLGDSTCSYEIIFDGIVTH